MKRAFLSVFLFAAACGGKSTPPPACPAGPTMATAADLTAIEDKMCGCGGDFECVEAVFQEHAGMGLTFAQVGELAESHGRCAHDDDTSSMGPKPPSGPSGLVECDAYVDEMHRYMACDKVPQQARDAAAQGLEAMQAGWANAADFPDDARKQANDACRQAVDALKQGMAAMGCAP
jgi:hypothetical protein